jgi:hypothetical protein
MCSPEIFVRERKEEKRNKESKKEKIITRIVAEKFLYNK